MKAFDSKNSNVEASGLSESAWEAKKRNSLDSILEAHPEHYLVPDYEEDTIEGIGEHMARVGIT